MIEYNFIIIIYNIKISFDNNSNNKIHKIHKYLKILMVILNKIIILIKTIYSVFLKFSVKNKIKTYIFIIY